MLPFKVVIALSVISILHSTAEKDSSLLMLAKKDSKLNVTVFYESDCPDCRSFFKDQVGPNWKPFFRYIILDLIPYGNAEQEQDSQGNWKFTCQHGPDECFRNKIQACALKKMSKPRPRALLNFISCYMPKEDKDKFGPKCAKLFKIDFKKLKQCANSKEGSTLLAALGNRTHNFEPKIKWVPTIAFDGKYDEEDQDEAAENLKGVICKKLENKPKPCKNN